MLRALPAIFAFTILVSSMGCLSDDVSNSASDTVSSSDTIKAKTPGDPTEQTRSAVSCTGIKPPEGIQEMHHQQCGDWQIEECTSTSNLCEAEIARGQISTCCCILCGLNQGQPHCFNVKCP